MLQSFLLLPIVCWLAFSNFCFLHAFIRDDPYGHVPRMLHDILKTKNNKQYNKNTCYMPSPTPAESLSWVARYWMLQATFCANPSVFQPHESAKSNHGKCVVKVPADASTMCRKCIIPVYIIYNVYIYILIYDICIYR